MKMNNKKHSPLMKIINNSLIDLPSPSNIPMTWGFGSILGLSLMIQIITGLMLAIHYTPNIELAFNSISHISRNVDNGWFTRILHANGASSFFLAIYIHMGRGMYYGSHTLVKTWISGTMILFILMATAFLGYVLPWGQMSFWGATVITNLVSAIPYMGTAIVQWLWGGFAVDNATLNRFFTFHFILPFMIAAMVMIHLLMLHQSGSNNPLGLNSNIDKIPFHPYFSFKDLMMHSLWILMLLTMCNLSPYLLADADNFTPANPLVTPLHIQPEWYFLFAYAILRSIPNKLGGVISLIMSIAVFFFMPIILNKKFKSNKFYPMNKSLHWTFTITVLLLTWIGARPVEDPFIMVGQILTVLYFSLFLMMFISSKIQDNL